MIVDTAGRHLVWETAACQQLLAENPSLPPRLIGTLPTHPQQNRYAGLPLLLLPDEAARLLRPHGSRAADSIHTDAAAEAADDDDDDDGDDDAATVHTGAVHIKAVGASRRPVKVEASGLKYGGHRLRYPGDPAVCHADAIVHRVAHFDRPTLRATDIAARGRLAHAVHKKALLVYTPPSRSDPALASHASGTAAAVATPQKLAVSWAPWA